MKAAGINEIKQELKQASASQLVEICVELARFKNDNKQLLTYLLFEAADPEGYIRQVKETIDLDFLEINQSNLYYVKKSLRKILRKANKHIRYTRSKTAEAEILLHFLTNFRGLNLKHAGSTQLANMYAAQVKKIKTAIDAMHEDLQFEYRRELKRLEDM